MKLARLMSLPPLVILGLLPIAAQQGSGRQADSIPGGRDDGLDEEVRDQLEAIDPLVVGWITEDLNSRCGSRLKLLAHILEEDPRPDVAALEELVSPNFQGGRLRPLEPRTVFIDDVFEVRRGLDEDELEEEAVRGREELAGELARMIAPLWGSHAKHAPDGHSADGEHEAEIHFHFKFKIIRVVEHEEGVQTDLYFAADGAAEDHLVEQSSTWRVEWTPAGDDAAMLIRSIVCWDYEEVSARRPGRSLFTDCTGSMFAGDPGFEEQLVPGIDHWRARMTRNMGQPLLGAPCGVAVGDVDGDGLEDVFFCQPGGLPNLLYLNAGDGTVVPAPDPGDVALMDFTRSALLVDLDGDGDRDMAVVVGAEVAMFENDGTGRFTWRALTPAPSITMLTAVDYDLDGDVDLYATGYSTPYDDDYWPVPFHDANNGQRNFLIENRGNWEMADVTAKVGLDRNNTRFSFASCWEDYDNDGDPDLYISNDFGRNCLYRNDAGHFTDVAAEAGVEDISAGMSTHWGDFNGDGWMDVFISNMFSSAGNRVTYQRSFKPSDQEDVRGHYRRHARGNTLFLNVGDGTFQDVSEDARITMGRWAWGSIFTDLNNDGRLDLVVPNGFLTSTRTHDL